MAKFVFQYEALLRHRRHLERQRQRELAELFYERNTIQHKLRGMQDTITQAKHDMRQGLVGKVDLDAISGFTRYAGQTEIAGHQTAVQLARLEKKVQSARMNLLEATKARRALERLREKQEARWRQELRRKEERELDDIATQRFNHGQVAGGIRR